MTFVQPLSEPKGPLSASSPTRPGFFRSNSTPTSRPVPTLQSHPATSLSTPRPALKKRHSAHSLTPPSVIVVETSPPQRPPRNPARTAVPAVHRPGTTQAVASLPPIPIIDRNSKLRPSTATGGREEITPWEFHPVPTTNGGSNHARESANSAKFRPSLNVGLVEEVTPWELFPAPSIEHDAQKPVAESQHSKHSRTSTSIRQPSSNAGTSRSLSEMALRRRRSSGNKISKPRASMPPASVPTPESKRPVSSIHTYAHQPLPPTHTPRPKSAPSTPKLSPQNLPHSIPPALPLTPGPSREPKTPPRPPDEQLRFSTADRTILEELKRNIMARESQFVIKGASAGGPTGVRVGRKHHAYPRTEVPYPRSYEREVLDLDIWETVACEEMCQSLTWHVFQRSPTKVLDIGCGTGTWVLNCARTWRDCLFVGLDIVPLQPDLRRVGADFASRITWTQANFLDGLPFPNEEFDYVHAKRIALGVPEDKWDFLLEEITRVMKPGGAFEMVEEDLFFPAQTDDDDSADRSAVETNHSKDHISEHTEHTYDADRTSIITASGSSQVSIDAPSFSSSVTNSTYQPSTTSRSASPPPIREVAIAEDEEKEALEGPPLSVPKPPPLPPNAAEIASQASSKVFIPPHSRSANRPILRVNTPRTQHHNSLGQVSELPPLPRPGSQAKVAYPTPSLLSSLSTSSGALLDAKYRRRHSGVGITAMTPIASSQASPETSPIATTPRKPLPPKSTPFLLRTFPKKPINPRDHSLLETIYLEMLASRFINVAPLSILASSLGLHFSDVRTHAPIQFSFPPRYIKQKSQARRPPVDYDHESESDGGHDSLLPTPQPRRRSRGTSVKGVHPTVQTMETGADHFMDDQRFLSMQSLLQDTSPYVSLDGNRLPALSPKMKVTTLSSDQHTQGGRAGGVVTGRRKSRALPNMTLNIDLKTLNLHLAIRTAEVMACSESMWEWVKEFHNEVEARKKDRTRSIQPARRNRSGSLEIVQQQRPTGLLANASGKVTDAMKQSIMELTREDFEGLLTRFEMDMRDHIAISSELETRFQWSVFSSSPTQDRKVFDVACEKWEQWEEEERGRSDQVPRYSTGSRHRPSNSVSTQHASLDGHAPDGHEDRSEQREQRGLRRGDVDPNEPGRRRSASEVPPHQRLSVTQAGPTRHSYGSAAPAQPRQRLSRAMRVFLAWKA